MLQNSNRWSRSTLGAAINDPASPNHIYGVKGSGEIVFGLDYDPDTGRYSAQVATKIEATVRGRFVVVVAHDRSLVEVWSRDPSFQPKTLLFTNNRKVLDSLRMTFTPKDLDNNVRLLCGVVAEAQTVWANNMQAQIDAEEANDIPEWDKGY